MLVYNISNNKFYLPDNKNCVPNCIAHSNCRYPRCETNDRVYNDRCREHSLCLLTGACRYPHCLPWAPDVIMTKQKESTCVIQTTNNESNKKISGEEYNEVCTFLSHECGLAGNKCTCYATYSLA